MIPQALNYEIEVIYTHPDDFNETLLDKYWLSDTPDQRSLIQEIEALTGSQNTVSDRVHIRKGVLDLREQYWHYAYASPECISDPKNREKNRARSITVQIQKIHLLSNSVGRVSVYQSWFLPVHDECHLPVKERGEIKGPYIATYNICKSQGRWLIYNSDDRRFRPFWRPELVDFVRLGILVTVFAFTVFYRVTKGMEKRQEQWMRQLLEVEHDH